MNETKLIVTIDNNGNVTIDVNGVESQKCLNLTKDLEEKLGSVKSRDMKSEKKGTLLKGTDLSSIKKLKLNK
jgi:hypothetical protein